MVRLMLTLAPIACILAAVGMSGILQRFTASLRFGQKKTDSDGSGGEPRLKGVASWKVYEALFLVFVVVGGSTALSSRPAPLERVDSTRRSNSPI